MTLRWAAAYGGDYALEEVRTLTLRVDEALRRDMGTLAEGLRFADSGGPVHTAARGATVSGDVDYQAWASTPTGACPGCWIQFVLYLSPGAVLPGGCVHRVEQNGSYPGKTTRLPFSFKAPAEPGTYTLRGGHTLESSCNGAVPLPGASYDLGLLIVN